MTAPPARPPLRRRGPSRIWLAAGATLFCSAFSLPDVGRVSFEAEGVELRSVDGTRLVVGRDSARVEVPRPAGAPGNAAAAPGSPRPASAAPPADPEPRAPGPGAPTEARGRPDSTPVTPTSDRPSSGGSTAGTAPASSPRAEPSPFTAVEPVQARYEYAPAGGPAARHRFAWAVSAWLLALLAAATLALRLTIGWPRFPPRYRGRRRVRGR
ncbi:hypothetical protein [Marinactinospora rubrisoli]|uniref:Uncharacterized protein n=1 Tax=Marinactinospora rubrisoli TaxID=2715399 RepID=A0ABW2KB14_9ACTN